MGGAWGEVKNVAITQGQNPLDAYQTFFSNVDMLQYHVSSEPIPTDRFLAVFYYAQVKSSRTRYC